MNIKIYKGDLIMEDMKLKNLYSIWYDSTIVNFHHYDKILFLNDILNNLNKINNNLKLFSLALELDKTKINEIQEKKITHNEHGKGMIKYILSERGFNSRSKEYNKVEFRINKKKINIKFNFYNYDELKNNWSNLKLSETQINDYKKEILNYLKPIQKKIKDKKIYVNEKFKIIYNDFKKEIESREQLCELNDLYYKNNNLPNYNSKILQQYYLLRYYYAYFYEYYIIYKKILEEDFINPPYEILSIGCGSYIDYSAFKFALIETKKNYTEYPLYVGLDRVNWNYKPKDNSIFFENKDICKSKKIFNQSKSNIFVFPRSFSELRNDFIQKINLSKNEREKVVFIAAHIESTKNSKIQKDQKRFYNLVKNKINNNFKFVNTLENSIYNFNASLRDKYPEDIKDFLINLSDNCPDNESCYNDNCRIEYKPRLNIDSISQIIKLEKDLSQNDYIFDVPF